MDILRTAWSNRFVSFSVSEGINEKNEEEQPDPPPGSPLQGGPGRRQRDSRRCLADPWRVSVNPAPSLTAVNAIFQVPAQPGRDAGVIHSIGSLIRARSKLLLPEDPDTVEIYKVGFSKSNYIKTNVFVLYEQKRCINIPQEIHFSF